MIIPDGYDIFLCRVWQARVHKVHLHKGGTLFYHDILAQVTWSKSGISSLGHRWASNVHLAVGWLRQCTRMFRSFMRLPCKTFTRKCDVFSLQVTNKLQKCCGTALLRSCIGPCQWPSSGRSLSSHHCAGSLVPKRVAIDAPTAWVGTNSHGLVCGRGRLLRSVRELHQSRHGWITTPGPRQSTCWRQSGWPRDTTWQTSCQLSGMHWWIIARRCQAVQLLRISMQLSEDGNWGMSCGEIRRQQCHQGFWPSLMSAAGPRELWRDGWLRWRMRQVITSQQLAASVVGPHVAFVQSVGWHLVGNVLLQERRTGLVVRRVAWQEELSGMSCRQHAVGRPQGTFCSGSSDDSPPTGLNNKDETHQMKLRSGLWIIIPMIGLATTGKSQVVHCGKDEPSSWLPVQEGQASSSSSQAHGQGGPARWAAVTALETAARERVLGWRLEQGLEDDADFAYRWASHEEAIVGAGHAVAHEWLRIRAEQTLSLLPAVAQVIDELPKPSPSVAPAIRRETRDTPKATMLGRKRRGVRLRANPSDAPEAITARVEALTGVMMRLGALAPSGTMTQTLQAEWYQACTRLSQRLITNAEKSTVLNAISTAEELRQFMRSRDRGCLPEKVDLDAFLHSSTTKAPVRALASLKWLNNNGQLGWNIQDLAAPKASKSRRTRGGQAEAITPPMLAFTEETIERMQRSGNERWTALLACWLISTGCLRYRHVARATPKRISLATMHCFCWRGKQKNNRSGFHFAVPSEFGSGFQWTQHWLELYLSLGETQRQRAGLCFDREGVPWAISEVNRIAQEVFSSSMEDVSGLTTYSSRRWGPTFGQALGLNPMELNALGDWQAKGDTPRDAVMPLHYSSARYSESMKMKHLLLLCSQSICEYEAWEVIPPSVLREAQAQGRQALDRQVHRDIQNVWAKPISPGEALTKFKLSKTMLARAASLKSKAVKAAEARAMPSTLGDRVLSAFLKNGQPLCGAYQLHRCGKHESQCDALHKCAVVLRSARVCGGRHAACDCHDKRYLSAEGAEPTKEVHPAPKAKEVRLPKPKKRPQRPKSPDHPPPAKRARAEQPIENNKVDEEKFDRLATVKGKTAQRPTLVLRNANGGEIWLSGLPTVATLEAFPAISLQIVCFSEPLERRGGVCCPGAQCKVLAPTDKENRDRQWKEVWPLLRQTYFGGESTLIHCMAGRHRAAGITILVRSLLKDCTIEESESSISSLRDIEFDKLMSTKHVADWIWWTFRHAAIGPQLPALQGYMATERSQLHLRTINDMPLCHHKQSTEKAAERLRSPLRTNSLQEAVAWGRPWCSSCIAKAPAGVQTMIRECWGLWK